MKINSAKNATMRSEHFQEYDKLAQNLGIESLKAIVLQVASKERIIENLKTDKYLNNIPLRLWDAKHESVKCLLREYVQGKGISYSWSLSQSVCLLKHIARYYIAESLGELEFEKE